MSEGSNFRVTFVRPDGWQYVTTGRAANEEDAIRSANELLEHVERICIGGYLTPEGRSVELPARLTVERVPATETESASAWS
jgi:hypothetical protein